MLNSYYAEMIDITTDNDIILYGYTFKDKNIREAKLHALDVSRQMQIVPLPTVWRISHKDHVRLSENYKLPSMIIRDEENAD